MRYEGRGAFLIQTEAKNEEEAREKIIRILQNSGISGCVTGVRKCESTRKD